MNYVMMALLLSLGACKTSGDLKGDRQAKVKDPVGVQTLESPVLSDSEEGEAESLNSPEALRRQLVIAQGELENLRHQMSSEGDSSKIRIAALEEENRKLTEALAAAPATRNQRVSAPTTASAQEAIELLWKQVVDGVKSGDEAGALVAAKSILSNYPKSKRVWGATLSAGMLEYNAKRYREAALHFNSAIDMTAKRSVGVSLPWYFQGLSFMQLKQKDNADLFLGELQRKYPQSVVAKKAKNIKTAPTNLFKDLPNWLDFMAP